MKRAFILSVSAALLGLTQAAAAVFVVTNTFDSGEGSLRWAIQQANADEAPDRIEFRILSPGPHRIEPASPLPDLIQPVVVDGRSQPGYSDTPLIEIYGRSAGPGNGLTLVSGGSTVLGLAITAFNGNGLELRGGTNAIAGNWIGVSPVPLRSNGNAQDGIKITHVSARNHIGGAFEEDRNVISSNGANGIHIIGFQTGTNSIVRNYIGLTPDGRRDAGNGENGVLIESSPGNIVGVPSPELGNVISANRHDGVAIKTLLDQPRAADGNVIQGNLIGTDATGLAALGNQLSGVTVLEAHTIQIGGVASAARNVISASGQYGIVAGAGTGPGLVIQGNYIGTDVAGGRLGNDLDGITTYYGVSGLLIGGTEAGIPGNTIANNGRHGVNLGRAGNGNAILGNFIFHNGGLGITLTRTGIPLFNDDGDGDIGPNGSQNHPELRGASLFSDHTLVSVHFNSRASTAYRVEFCISLDCDASGYGEGASAPFSVEVVTDSSGNADFDVTLPPLDPGTVLTATATDPDDNTSEFSPCLMLRPPGQSITMAAHGASASEVDTNILIHILRTGGSTGEISVFYATTNFTAKAGQDYGDTSGTLKFREGETDKTISIPIMEDALMEGPEQFLVTLSQPAGGAMLGDITSTVVTIKDNEPLPKLTIRRVSDGQGERLVVSWPAPAADFQLQTSQRAEDPGSWTGWKDPVVHDGDQNWVSANLPSPWIFFQLVRPRGFGR